MRRTTVYLEPELEILLKLESQRRKQPMAEVIREALHAYLEGKPRRAPRGAAAFDSGKTDTAERAEAILGKLRFGEDS
jgi:hypothetical protein